jgi:ribonuclease BN (tRNA processing enzyme)
LKAGTPLQCIDHIVLTHHHPDHIYGLSVLLLGLWLDGRKCPLHIHGLSETLRAARKIMSAFEWERWNEHVFYPVEFHRIPKQVIVGVQMTPEFTVSAAPTEHLLPSIALRFVSTTSSKAIAYSSDTVMCDPVVGLARGAVALFHEATTAKKALVGHSSAAQAGMQATRAGVKKLVLVHISPNTVPSELKAAAEEHFGGRVIVSKDFMRFGF